MVAGSVYIWGGGGRVTQGSACFQGTGWGGGGGGQSHVVSSGIVMYVVCGKGGHEWRGE